MKVEPPSSFNQHIFFEAKSVFYGTDDGYQDGSCTEFQLYEDFYQSVTSERRDKIHLVSAVGGLYGLNLISLWRPREITFFDINPHATAYFELIRKVFAVSSSKQNFLDRLSHQDYEVDNPAEELIRENLALKQQGTLPRSRGSSYKRSLEVSWKHALDHFDLTKGLLADVPLQVRTESIDSDNFTSFIRDLENVWMYCSNIVEFTFGGLRFHHPANAAIVSLVYPGQVELLDLAPFGDRPVEVRLEIPLKASVVDAPLSPVNLPSEIADEKGIQLANFCRDELRLAPDGRLLDIGCNFGRLPIALGDYLDRGGGEYEGFDPQREHVLWARQNWMPKHKSTSLHIANIRNRIYNPGGALSPTEFRFPYQDGRFDLVVAHSLFPYLLAEEFEHYAAEIARVLKPGGRLLATFFLMDEEAREVTRSLADPHYFRYSTGPITFTGPNRGGLGAYDEEYVRQVLRRKGIEAGPPIFGSWRGRAGARFWEDALVGLKQQRGQAGGEEASAAV
ncbi:MAG TPA: class I SAM-dependent methyltransferase [Chthoniobacterales bacterium]|nr:class I SAM-dependent methyltransferase [Chthoniobacterales bacterium]